MARSSVRTVRCRRGPQVACILAGLVGVIIPVAMSSGEASAAPRPVPAVETTVFGLEMFAQAPFKRSPFKRAPFKRAPFKRAPFKRGPFKRAEARSPFIEQLIPTNVQRAGALRSSTAAIDGIDELLDVDIAVLDGGVDAAHPDLRVAGSINCTAGGTLDRDLDGHGTMVAGLAAARDNGFGVVGVAPGARIWSVRVARPDGTITEQAARCGLQWLVDHADTIEVANLSWSGAGDPSDACGTSAAAEATRPRGGGGANVDPGAEPELHALACAAHDEGVVLVAAAGNDAADAAGVLPAAWGEVLAVSAIADSDGDRGGLGGSPCDTGELDDHLASFSNTGAPVAIAAGGVCVASTDARGGYATGSGTSFASPIVAGAAALLLVREPTLTPDQVRERLLAAAEPGPIPGDRDQTVEGVVDVGTD